MAGDDLLDPSGFDEFPEPLIEGGAFDRKVADAFGKDQILLFDRHGGIEPFQQRR